MKALRVYAPIRAFVRIGYLETISYPLSSVLGQVGTAIAVFSAFFLAPIVHQGPEVGGSYLAFVLMGLVGQMVVAGAFQGIGQALDSTIQQGRLETVLIEPIRWPLIPVALGIWPSIMQLVQVGVALAVGLLLGVSILVGGAPYAAVLIALGIGSGLVMGVIAASVRILAKRSDPVWLVYNFASGLVSGTAIPINLLPLPLRTLSWLIPTTYVTAGIRKALMPRAAGIYGLHPVGDIVALVGFIVFAGGFAVWIFSRSLDTGRRLGVLAGY